MRPIQKADEELLDSKTTIHDSHRFEIKLEFDVPEARRTSYRVEAYFFLPKALNIGPHTYSKAEFYNSLQKYIRFKTPEIPLNSVADPHLSSSPLNRIRRHMDAQQVGRLDNELVQEIKLLGVVSRGAVRDAARALLERLANAANDEAAILNEGRSFLENVRRLETAVDELRDSLLRPGVSARVQEAFRFFDEFFALMLEDYGSLLLLRLRESRIGALGEVDRGLAELLVAQQQHRKAMEYPSVMGATSDNSGLLYRKGVLKKLISSILHLHLETAEWEAVSQLYFAVAAGIAMCFAAGVTLFAQSRYSSDSAVFLTILVVSYMLKDRIKDWVKVTLSRRLVRWAPDRRVSIRDPYSAKVIGNFKEAFVFMDQSAVPEPIRRRRNMDNITSIDEEGKPERIIKYEKQVTLFPPEIFKFHERRRDINDIMRFDVSQWVRQADDPEVEYLHYDSGSDTLRAIPCAKVYHVNMVLKYQSGTGSQLERFRLILDRNGIVRMEEVRL